MSYQFRKATVTDTAAIWHILEKAIERRKLDGSTQWQDGYPNLQVVTNDIQKQIGYVMTTDDEIVGYCTVIVNDEPAYEAIEDKWLTNGDFLVIHRVAISPNYVGRGLSKQLLLFVEELAQTQHIYSIKADTNFDNLAMMRVFDQLGYQYCGEVYFRGSARRAYEKVLAK